MEKQKRDFELLAKLDNRKLAEIWGILNNWEWPKEIPDPENPPSKDRKRRNVLMKWINNTIGHKECLKYSNVTKSKRMTNEEFEKWWIENAI